MNKTIKKALGIALAVAMLGSVSVMLAGCGEGDKDQKATTAPATTVAATTQAADSSSNAQSQGNNAQSSDVQSSAQSSDSQSGNSQTNNDVYIDEQLAIQNALAQAGEDSMFLTDFKGYSPDGLPAWVITIKMPDGSTKIYYAGYMFTYSEDSANDGNQSSDNNNNNGGDYAGISTDDAMAKAVNALGGGADLAVTSIYQGYYNGAEAWVVQVTDAQDNSHIAYVGSDFCYF